MPAHFVIAYVNHGARLFSLTARKMDARLPEVDAQMAGLGFERVVIAEGLDKPVADAMKQAVHAAYVDAGYRHDPRESL